MAKPSNTMLAQLAIWTTLMFFSSSMIRSTAVSEIPDDRVPLYVFGDSMYDTGMALHINRGSVAMYWPYGETYFKRPAGRFSDGRLIPDFLAQYMNLSFPVPFVLPGLEDFTEAVNFADAGAGVLIETRPNTLNMKMQTEFYIDMVNEMKKKIGEEKTKKLLSKAIHLINIGGNDYVDLYNFNSKPLSPDLKISCVTHVLGNLSEHISAIYNQGARKFAYQSLAPMGCMPGFLQVDGSCLQDLNDLTIMHNAGFPSIIQKLQTQLQGFKYSLYDFSSSLIARLANGTNYGFKNHKSACCGAGPFNGEWTCQQKGRFTSCSNPHEYLWFDAGHPTEKAYQQFSQEFWSGTSNIVAPYNIKRLFEMQ